MQAFVPKNRRPRFELVLRIIDINNVPLGNSSAWVKWRLPSSSATESQGHTEKSTITDHRAYWNYEKVVSVRLTIDRTSMLQECEITFEVIQEFHSSPTSEKNVLGKIKLNLAEYVDKVEEDEGVVRRYLLYDSKVNCTVRIGISMRQIEGDRNFTTPPLKSATVFGGIARVVADPGDSDELGHLPSMNTKSREISDMQDMYRRTLAASWISRPCDLPADKLIEEIFKGGSSRNDSHPDLHTTQVGETHNDNSLATEPAERQTRSGKRLSPSFEKRPKSSSSSAGGGKNPESVTTLGHSQKGGSLEEHLHDGKGRTWKSRNTEHELSEFDVRPDLRSWEIRAKD